MKQFKGYSTTVDEAVNAAAEEALKSRQPQGADELVSLKLESIELLYGGLVGHRGTRVATVSLPEVPGKSKAAAGPELSLHLAVCPEITWVDMMPGPGGPHRPQPRDITFILTVTNTGNAEFNGKSPTSTVVPFRVRRGSTEIWSWPQVDQPVVTPVSIRPRETLTYTATWEIADAVPLVNAALEIHAEFIPSGDSARERILIKPAW